VGHSVTALSRMKKSGNKAIAIDHDQVRATYLSTGSLKEAALAHGLKPETVRKWSQREGWETTATLAKLEKRKQEIVQAKREAGHDDVPAICHASDAIASLLEKKKGETQTALAVAVSNASVAASELHPLEALESSRKLKDLADTYGKLWPTEQGAAQISVNVLGLSLDGFAPRPVIDL